MIERENISLLFNYPNKLGTMTFENHESMLFHTSWKKKGGGEKKKWCYWYKGI
jgi:hypothetical protein